MSQEINQATTNQTVPVNNVDDDKDGRRSRESSLVPSQELEETDDESIKDDQDESQDVEDGTKVRKGNNPGTVLENDDDSSDIPQYTPESMLFRRSDIPQYTPESILFRRSDIPQYAPESMLFRRSDTPQCTPGANFPRNSDIPQYTSEDILARIKEHDQRRTTLKTDLFEILHVIISLIAILGIMYYTGGPINGGETRKLTKSEEFNSNLLKLRSSFKNQDDSLWTTAFKEIKYVNISNPTRPAILMLMHKNNKLTAQCLSWQIANAARQFFDISIPFIEIVGEDLNYKGNELINVYKEPLRQKVIMLVLNLDKITANVAKSFHIFCDYHNPLVKRAVILFTIDESSLKNDDNTINSGANVKPSKRAGKLLKSLWGGQLMDSVLTPLITRITETVIEIKSEDKILCPNN